MDGSGSVAAAGVGLFGEVVVSHRERLGLTQEALAAVTGLSARRISELESSRVGRPRKSTVTLLADAFGLSGAGRERFIRQAYEPGDPAPQLAPSSARPSVLVPRQLPARPHMFTGRVMELEELGKIHEASTVLITAINGMAGVGKTALAVHWAHQVANRFPDGQLYVNLRGFDPGGQIVTPEQALRGFLDALGVSAERIPPNLDAQTAQYRSLIAGKRLLVLLDNARDAHQVRPLLPAEPTAMAVVTSRNQLTPLVAVEGAYPVTLDLLTVQEAGQLLTSLLGTGRVAAEPQAVQEIIAACARLPLALAIAAARALQSGFPLAALASELNITGQRLDVLDGGDTSTQVRSVFSWSYATLSEPAARLFRLLAVHPGPDISAAAAASLAGRPVPETRHHLLAELVRAHLVSERLPGRYSLHDLLRVYAGELVTANQPHTERNTAVRRLLDHYLHCGHRADAVLNPAREVIELVEPTAGVPVYEFGSEGAATDWFTAEYQVLRATVRLAVDAGLDRHAWQLVWSMATYLERHQGFRDAVALQQIALQAARRLGDLPAQAYSHRLLGRAHAMLGDHDEARTHLDHALDAYQQLGDNTNQGLVHLGLAAMLDRQGRYRDALHQAEQALARFQTSGHRIGQANALNNIGWFRARLGEYETSLKYCEQALGLQQELGNRRGEALTWDSLGVAYHHLGRHAEAIAAYQQALTLLRHHGNRYYEAETLVHLGDIHHAGGDTDAARDCWRAALTILTDVDHPDAEQARARLHNTP